MLTEIRPHLAETAEIDDAGQSGSAGGGRERGSELPILVGIGAGGGHHGVDEVVGRPAPAERVRHGRAVAEVAGDHLDARIMPPGAGIELARLAHQTAHAVARREQRGHQPPADVARGAGHEHGLASIERRSGRFVHGAEHG